MFYYDSIFAVSLPFFHFLDFFNKCFMDNNYVILYYHILTMGMCTKTVKVVPQNMSLNMKALSKHNCNSITWAMAM